LVKKRIGQSELSQPLRQVVAEAWTFRFNVEREAAIRFERLAKRLERIGALPSVIEMAVRASHDEVRHARHCADLARRYGATLIAGEISVPEISPPGLGDRESILYEVVAACCITETESTSVLTTLFNSASDQRVHLILRQLLRDEVGHSRLGWAHLAHESTRGDVQYLSRLIPDMLEVSAGERLFDAAAAELESPELLHHGVLPHSMKRSVFTLTLLEVVFPGLESLGVPSGPAREWLVRKSSPAPQPL
jgi:hypothetical protein